MVAINCDMGEGYGVYRCGDDEAIMPYVDMANVACGFHASDPSVMRRTVRLAKRHGVQVGAHPSYPDRQGFGRRAMAMDPEEITASIIYQAGALSGFLTAEGMRLGYVALWQVCPHLGCKVPVCGSSQWFECPCHGSKYNRVGEKKSGPAPRGMDRFPVTIEGGNVFVDTGKVSQGPAIGTDSTGQGLEGPHCA